MNNKDLREYIGILADMENSIYAQNTLIKSLKEHSSTLAKPHNIQMPCPPTKKENSSYMEYRTVGVTLLILGLICLPGSYFVIFPLFNSAVLGTLTLFLGIFFIIKGIIKLYSATKSYSIVSKENSKYEEAMEKYQSDLAYYDNQIKEDQKRIDKEEREKQFIVSEIRSIESSLTQSRNRLKEMYNIGIVFPKYRNMAMINTILEYLESGRCATLDGVAGAYNLLERELEMQRVIIRLDTIISQLEMIRQNQYMLYSAIEDTNRKVSGIVESTKEISKKLDDINSNSKDYTQEIHKLQATSSVTAYNLERVEKELHYMNRMKYYAGEYDGKFFNLPPQ